MATDYFAKIPTIGYDIDGSGEKVHAIDILQRAVVRDLLTNNYLIFYQYAVKDGETPEHIANKLYGSSTYHWIVLLANDIIDPYYDWPMSYENLILTIRKKYTTTEQDGLQYAYSTTHHYEDSFGNVIDEDTYSRLPLSERSAVSYYQWETNINESKRQIRLLDKKYVTQIDAEMDAIMKQALV